MYIPHFVYPFICPRTLGPFLSTFWLLWIVLLWISVYKYVFPSWVHFFYIYILRSGTAGSYGNSMFNIFLGTTVLFTTASIPFCILQSTSVSISLHPCQHLLFSGLFGPFFFGGGTMTILMGVNWTSLWGTLFFKNWIDTNKCLKTAAA